MKKYLLLPFVLLAQQVFSTGYPSYQTDPETVKDCIEWYDNDLGASCDTVRTYFGITLEEFKTWNPSIGLDCTPWYEWVSYCILSETKFNATKPTTTSSSSTVSSTTTTAATLAPSPTAWTDLGCYVEDPKFPILEQNMNPNGDATLTIPKCKQSCYRRAFEFAGVQNGNQCWCSGYVGGTWANNQTSCDTPCTGDKNTFCGGHGFLNVFRAEQNKVPSTISTGSVATMTAAVSTSGV
ncbi:hypothetical protein DM02DRAFT_608045 [Periconia macrospinosa]|uniref:WSC domain-containing protein n=1 Tax=Periconia macrospinosa TaxID=97972 RepID=A0A2V1EDS9_9PLEO|nr:hypothetical protein DM02DRAFT_608045 [Periconia macrospinosa]